MGNAKWSRSRQRAYQTTCCFIACCGLLAISGAQASAETGASRAPIEYGSASNLATNVQSAHSSGPLDLRPGAKPVSFAPSVQTVPLTPIASRPSTSSQFAEPYAGPAYQVQGKWFVPMHEPDYDEVGIASWYGPGFHGKKTSTGEVYDQHAFTAAHPTLPIPSTVRVTNIENGRSILVRLNDRGPYVDDRLIDLSRAAADKLDVVGSGTARVRVQYVGPAPVEANTVADERGVAARTIVSQVPVAASVPSRPAASITSGKLEPMLRLPRPESQAPEISAPAPQAAAGQVMLQAGSFSDLNNAHRLRNELSGMAPTFLTSVEINGSQFYRVMFGPWSSESSALQVRQKLESVGKSSLIVRQ